MKRRDRRAGERRIVIPVLKGIAGAGCRAQGVIRVLNRVARERSVRVCRRKSRRNRVIQRPLHVVGIRRAPLCVDRVILCSRRVDCRNRNRETFVPIPAEEGITPAGRCLQGDGRIRHIEAARVGRRIACRMTRRGRIVQHIGNRIRQGRTPLCVEIGRVCITLRRIQRCRSGRSKRRICKPTEEIVPRTNRPKEGIHRVFDRIARESPILIVCRLCHGIVQVIAEVIGLSAPLRVVVSISRRCFLGIQSCNRTSRKGRIIVPTFKVVPGPGHRQERNVRIRNIIRPLVIRVVCQNCSHRGRIHIVRILNLIPDWVPVCGHCDHITVLRREQGRRRAVRIGLTVRSAPVQKAVTVHCKAVRQVCSCSAGNGLIRHGAGRRMPRRCVRDKLHRILVRVSGHRSRYIANRIGTDCPAARSSVVKARRCERRRILRRRSRNRLAVVKVYGNALHAVIADEAGHRHIGRIPEESLGRRHGARIHGNGERHIDRTTCIAECAVRALHEEGAAVGHIDGAVVHNRSARRYTEGLAVRFNHDTRRNVLRHNRVVGQRNHRVTVPA